jgi:hypothetical protein
MAANTTPIFIRQGDPAIARISAANTAVDGSGSLVTLVTAGPDGTRVDAVRFRNSGSTGVASGNNIHRIFLSNTGGTAARLIGEVATPTATRSATVIGSTSIFTFDQPVIMVSGQIMYVTQLTYTDVRDQYDVIAYAGDY